MSSPNFARWRGELFVVENEEHVAAILEPSDNPEHEAREREDAEERTGVREFYVDSVAYELGRELAGVGALVKLADGVAWKVRRERAWDHVELTVASAGEPAAELRAAVEERFLAVVGRVGIPESVGSGSTTIGTLYAFSCDVRALFVTPPGDGGDDEIVRKAAERLVAARARACDRRVEPRLARLCAERAAEWGLVAPGRRLRFVVGRHPRITIWLACAGEPQAEQVRAMQAALDAILE